MYIIKANASYSRRVLNFKFAAVIVIKSNNCFFLQFTSPYLDNHSRPEAGHEGEEDKAQHLDEPNIQGVLHSLPDWCI